MNPHLWFNAFEAAWWIAIGILLAVRSRGSEPEECRLARIAAVAFAVFGDPAAQSSIGAFFETVEAYHDLSELPHGPLFGLSERGVFEPMITGAGLVDFELEPSEFVWRLESPEPVVEGFTAWGNLAALPSDVREKIQARTRTNLERFKRHHEYVLPHEALVGNARKPRAA